MTNATLLDAIRAATPEERQLALYWLLKQVQAESAAPVDVKDEGGRVYGRFVPGRTPPPITQADLDEHRRRLAATDKHRDIRDVIAEHVRRAASRTG
jgi:hypothetical protein